MVKLVLISKTCELSEESYDGSLSNVHKAAGFKTRRGFSDRGSWPWNNSYITLYAKETGRANSENKYELPPPLDTDLFFDTMILVKHSDLTPNADNLEDLTVEEWKKCYEKLYGGFEDLDKEEEYSSDEYIPPELQTKHGYSKEGGFVVDSDDDEDEEEGEEEEEEWIPEQEEKDSDVEESEEEEEEWNHDGEDSEEEQGSELSEESYIDSDSD
tara:strand:- start:526 stop:1167 length:642 start_codon:yes stop_codon:yes gene_type:complete